MNAAVQVGESVQRGIPVIYFRSANCESMMIMLTFTNVRKVKKGNLFVNFYSRYF
jgi:hypothetical protein